MMVTDTVGSRSAAVEILNAGPAPATRSDALLFSCGDDRLVGILALPSQAQATTGVLIVVGGPQYRAGSQRQFARMARAISEHGLPVLRFDVRGMGDSSGEQRGFEALHDDIASAIDAFQRRLPAIRSVVLLGLCDGASASLMYWHRSRDSRVAGIAALNPWVRTPQTQAQTRVRHYYWERLWQREFWLKLFSGGVAWRAVSELANNLRHSRAVGHGAGAKSAAVPYVEAMASAAASFESPLLVLLSGQDYTAKEFLAHVAQEVRWQRRLTAPNATRVDLADADHTFSGPAAHQAMVGALLRWLSSQGMARSGGAGE